MLFRKLSVAAAVLTLSGVAPVGASAADTPATSGAAAASYPMLTFVPPAVGPICIAMGEIVLDNITTSPGLHVCTTVVQPH